MSTSTAADTKLNRSVLRANAFHALARAYAQPQTWPDEFPGALAATFSPFGGELAALSGRLVALWAHKDQSPEKLASVHSRLFIGPFDIQAPPWASIYLDPEKQLMGKCSRYAAEAYAEAGLGPVDGPTDAPDHVTHELEFMYFLAFQEYSTGKLEWQYRQMTFWKEHLGIWLPQFVTQIQSSTAADSFYNLLSCLTHELCQVMDAQFQSVSVYKEY